MVYNSWRNWVLFSKTPTNHMNPVRRKLELFGNSYPIVMCVWSVTQDPRIRLCRVIISYRRALTWLDVGFASLTPFFFILARWEFPRCTWLFSEGNLVPVLPNRKVKRYSLQKARTLFMDNAAQSMDRESAPVSAEKISNKIEAEEVLCPSKIK